MSTAMILSLSPLLALSAGALLIMMQIAVVRRPAAARGIALLTFAATFFVCVVPPVSPAGPVTPLLLADTLAVLLCGVFALAGIALAVLSHAPITARTDQPDEYYLLLVLATLGACVLVFANHVASLLLGLELLSLSLYALVAYPSREQEPIEAATKYLVLSGAATAILLFGFALLYAATGVLEFSAMGDRLADPEAGGAVLLCGAVMVLVGLCFKLAAAPLHLWTPDVYQGAPSPITGFLASVAKVAPFIVLLRLFIGADLFRFPVLVEVTALLAALSMVIGNLLALLQSDIKRMLAYSSIAHVGYLLIIFSAGSEAANRALAAEAAVFYLIAYVPTIIAALAVLSMLTGQSRNPDHVPIDSVRGLFWRQPLAALVMLFAMLSLAGIPLTAGFIGKLYIYAAAVAGEHWLLLALLIIGTGLGIYYYLRVVYEMTRGGSDVTAAAEDSDSPQAGAGLGSTLVTAGLLVAIVALGVLPQPLMHFLSRVFQGA